MIKLCDLNYRWTKKRYKQKFMISTGNSYKAALLSFKNYIRLRTTYPVNESSIALLVASVC